MKNRHLVRTRVGGLNNTERRRTRSGFYIISVLMSCVCIRHTWGLPISSWI